MGMEKTKIRKTVHESVISNLGAAFAAPFCLSIKAGWHPERMNIDLIEDESQIS